MSHVQVYGADWCEDTQETRRHLDELGVAYDYHDIDREPRARAWVQEMNGGKQKTPTLDVMGRVLSEPDDAELDRALRETGIAP